MISIVMPVRDEVQCAPSYVVELLERLAPREVIVVDDGSTDGTAAAILSLGRPQVRLLRGPRAGKSAALARGIARVRGEIVVLLDGDGQFDPADVERVIEAVRSGAALAIGTVPRKWDGQSGLRRCLSAGLAWYTRQVWGLPWRDINSGLKAVRLTVARRRRLRRGDHRILPLIWRLRESEIQEVEVRLLPRRSGRSKTAGLSGLVNAACELAATTLRWVR